MVCSTFLLKLALVLTEIRYNSLQHASWMDGLISCGQSAKSRKIPQNPQKSRYFLEKSRKNKRLQRYFSVDFRVKPRIMGLLDREMTNGSRSAEYQG
jgi:hypothetical protein